MVASHSFPGWVIFFDERFTEAPSVAQSVEHLSSREYLSRNVLQIDVHLMCLETFFVKDRETNEVQFKRIVFGPNCSRLPRFHHGVESGACFVCGMCVVLFAVTLLVSAFLMLMM